MRAPSATDSLSRGRWKITPGQDGLVCLSLSLHCRELLGKVLDSVAE